MKKAFIGLFAIMMISFAACNRVGDKSYDDHNTSRIDKDSAQHAHTQVDKSLIALNPTFSDIDPKASTFINLIIDRYILIKNALANDNGIEAARGGKEMVERMSMVDKSFFTPEQKKLYDSNDEDLKEHAEHIGEKAGDIVHQRIHFAMMSEEIYSLVKGFGGVHSLYRDYCQMYNENKGAIWLSEIKEIKNPYFGGEMVTCGRIEEVIK